jgi:predicted O-linked N-acetylglucosamine transferase (SPINDLY family)
MNIQQAYKAHQSGQLELAEKEYLSFLKQYPNHADALHLLGCLKKQKKDYFDAIHLIEKAISISPKTAPYYYNLGLACYSTSRIQQAIDAWKKTIDLDPDFIDAYANMGYAYLESGNLHKAREVLMTGYQKEPNHQLVLLNLASVWYQKNDFDHARQCYQELLTAYPDHIQALKNYGRLLYKTGCLIESINCLLHAVRLDPHCIDTWYHLGCAYQDNFQDEDAIKCFQTVLSLDSKNVKAYYNLGKIENAKGHFTSAKKLYQKALEIQPDFAEILISLGLLFFDVADCENAQFYIQQAIKHAKNHFFKIGSIHLYSLNFLPQISSDKKFSLHQKWGKKIIKERRYQFVHNKKHPNHSPIKIGYVSPDFKTHSVAYFILPVLKHHNTNEFQIYLYANVNRPDQMTEKIRKHCYKYRNIRGMETRKSAKLIYEDQLDILIDLAGHTYENLLDVFAMKPAPIQMTYLGYPATTGLETMDYRITDIIADPGIYTSHYTEKLIHIPPPFICYQPPDNAPEISELPMIKNGYITFGSFNHLGKINHSVIQLWSVLLNKIPTARLVLKSRPFHDKHVQDQFKQLFLSNGIENNRLDFRGTVSGIKNHLSHYHDIDIALDPFPYNGTTTTCESLWMGVPVLTVSGNCHAGRVGSSLLKSIGLNEWVAQNSNIFIQKAMMLERQPDLLLNIRYNMRNILKVSDLCNANLHTKKLESVYMKLRLKSSIKKNKHFC